MTKIIWVDDEINQAELRPDKEELKDLGCEIVGLKSADEFINFLSKPHNNTIYDAIIIDMMLPVGAELDIKDAGYGSRTGLLLIDKIRENTLYENVKLIVYSIVDDVEIAKKCEEKGVLYLKKTEILSSEFADKVMGWIAEN